MDAARLAALDRQMKVLVWDDVRQSNLGGSASAAPATRPKLRVELAEHRAEIDDLADGLGGRRAGRPATGLARMPPMSASSNRLDEWLWRLARIRTMGAIHEQTSPCTPATATGHVAVVLPRRVGTRDDGL
jgi:hypothetical protein